MLEQGGRGWSVGQHACGYEALSIDRAFSVEVRSLLWIENHGVARGGFENGVKFIALSPKNEPYAIGLGELEIPGERGSQQV
jgi:hypothetical protein